MKPRVYSSLAAFLAHYAALRADADRLAAGDAATLTEMQRLIEELGPADRQALDAQTADAVPPGSAARHRARAELRLHRILAARGILAG